MKRPGSNASGVPNCKRKKARATDANIPHDYLSFDVEFIMEFAFEIIGTFVLGGVVATYAKLRSKPPVLDTQSGRVLLKPARLSVLLAWLCVGIVGFVGGFAIWEQDPENLPPQLMLIAFFGSGGGYLLLHVYVAQSGFDKEGLFKRTLLGKQKRMAWADVRTARYSSLQGGLVIKGSRGKLVISDGQQGFDALVQAVTLRCGISAEAMKVPK